MKSAPQRNLDKLLGRAMSLHQEGDLDRAEAAYRDILSSDSRHTGALTLLGTLYLQRGQREEGARLLGFSLGINPRQPNAYNSCGNALKDMKRYNEALAHYDRACALDPDFAEAHYNRGVVLKELGRYDDALASYGKAIELQPDYVRAYNNRGNILNDLQEYDKALFDYNRAIALQPDNALIWNNRGNALSELRRHPDALASYDRTIALQPDYAEAYVSRGMTLWQLNRYDEALASYDRAMLLQPDYAEACFGKGLIQITLGEWEEGWKLYEWRWKADGMRSAIRNFSQPLWLGMENLADKTVLLYADQGVGDAILACRYVPMVEALGASVIVEVGASLLGLMSTLGGTVRVVAKGDSLPAFDFQCPLMSLPLAFGTTVDTVPAEIPYLAADSHKILQWQERLGAKTKLRVGLAWSGSGRYRGKSNFRRDIPFSEFRKIMQADCDYACLQNDIRAAHRDALAEGAGVGIYDDVLNDFSDTAALISEMDLVISVDTAVAHLAGALGKPVWILLPDPPDFMSMTEREDSLWYPTARLFRQTRTDDWGSVLERVAEEMEKIST